jgi:hypothetical protein
MLARTMGQDVHDRPARLTEHETPDTPLLVAEQIGDFQAHLDSLGVNSVDVSHFYRDAWAAMSSLPMIVT